ncbi:cytochrome P460 family protein [Galbibacter mesophilus]|uniref:cytochrome P460 family protein n=1 Tax=Galbibacter mesophilus TaxID=379069 RepID=UPI00191E00B5|nr:cytochrome P460 family protein [Galbibacter mesophilus]MCM5662627.1 cytochrome P460 family protein [Galbibacter mesophilus]
MKKLFKLSAIGFSMVVLAGVFAFKSEKRESFVAIDNMTMYPDKMVFNDQGELIRPTKEMYAKWVFVGANVTPAELNQKNEVAFPGFHNTYIHPLDFDYFKENGEFRDGTQFIQVNAYAGNKGASGNGYFSQGLHSIKASVKSKERFPNRPGNWGFFKWQGKHSDEPSETSKVYPVQTCNQCHVAFAKKDYVFAQFYPILREFDPKGK